MQVSIANRIRIGVLSGLVGGFAIFFFIFIIDFHLGMIPGTFYKTVGFPIGLEGILATFFGLVSHMFTAALIGAVFCICSRLHQKLELSNINKGIVAGGITGVIVYLLFFIPITLFVIQPLIELGTQNDLGLIATISNIESVHLLQNMNLIVWGSLVIHVWFGVIMGLTASLFLKQATRISYFHKKKTMPTIAFAIIAGTISIGVFYGLIADHTSELQQTKLTEELSKIRADLTYGKFIDMVNFDNSVIQVTMNTVGADEKPHTFVMQMIMDGEFPTNFGETVEVYTSDRKSKSGTNWIFDFVGTLTVDSPIPISEFEETFRD